MNSNEIFGFQYCSVGEFLFVRCKGGLQRNGGSREPYQRPLRSMVVFQMPLQWQWLTLLSTFIARLSSLILQDGLPG